MHIEGASPMPNSQELDHHTAKRFTTNPDEKEFDLRSISDHFSY
jgi:hypothetical protein